MSVVVLMVRRVQAGGKGAFVAQGATAGWPGHPPQEDQGRIRLPFRHGQRLKLGLRGLTLHR